MPRCARARRRAGLGPPRCALSLSKGSPGPAIRARLVRLGTLPGGGVSERPKEHASKACEVKASEGSNPSATANVISQDTGDSRTYGLWVRLLLFMGWGVVVGW